MCCVPECDLILAADSPLRNVFENFSAMGCKVETLSADLSNLAKVVRLVGVIHNRPVAALMAFAGHGWGAFFLIRVSRHLKSKTFCLK